MKDLAGKTAFVTGAASGIGSGIATVLSQAGVKVMLCDIEEAALTKAVADLKLTNADVDGVKADVSLKGELQAAADATVARYGKVHILVNNAGIGGGGSYGRWTDASWNWTIGVNLMSVVWGVEIFGPLIEANGEGGHIVSHGFHRWADSRVRSRVRCDQIWGRGALGRTARGACASWDRGGRIVSGLHSHANHELAAECPSAVRHY
jgi:NAD(P)-dependent dehydrogenase (short-subunit alcohol dehydrogenase family)